MKTEYSVQFPSTAFRSDYPEYKSTNNQFPASAPNLAMIYYYHLYHLRYNIFNNIIRFI